MTDFVGYLRVSTGKQQLSGLGLEAQAEAIGDYVRSRDGRLIQTFVEIESGSVKNRPELTSALAVCRRTRATLVIAKLDRLARNVAFVASLMDAGTDFVAVDAPYANRLMIHIMSAFAEHEREQISQRTRAALAAAKARGVVLGSNGRNLAQVNRARARKHALCAKASVQEAVEAGCGTLRSIADYLNAKGVPTAEGGKWHPTTVARVQRTLQTI